MSTQERDAYDDEGYCHNCGCPWQQGRTEHCDEQPCCHRADPRPVGLRALIASRREAPIALD